MDLAAAPPALPDGLPPVPLGRSPSAMRDWFDDAAAALIPDRDGTLPPRPALMPATHGALTAPGCSAWCDWCDRYVFLAFDLCPVSGQSGMECDRPDLERALNGQLPESHSRPQRVLSTGDCHLLMESCHPLMPTAFMTRASIQRHQRVR